jgi:RNA-directed DNA polymerase
VLPRIPDLHDYITDKKIINYLWQFLNRTVEWGGLYPEVKRGIPRGASPSPLLGAFNFPGPDLMMENLEKRYLRYMDEILILAPTK